MGLPDPRCTVYGKAPHSTALVPVTEFVNVPSFLAAGVGLAATLFLTGGTAAIAQTSSSSSSASPVQMQSESASVDAVSTPQPAATTLIFVNPTIGNDTTGDGSQRSPFKTLTHALEGAQFGTAIMLSSGTYSAESGEQFPILMRPGVTIQGDPRSQGNGILIRGGGLFLSPTFAGQNVALVGADEATITGVTVRNPNARGYGLWIESSSPRVVQNTFTTSIHDGISISGTSSPLIQGNRFHQNGGNGISIFGAGQPDVRDNVFEQTGFGINVGQYAAPRISNNRILNNRDGIVVQGYARPVLRNNVITGSQRDGLVAIAQGIPDLGRPDDPGNNQFQNNGRYDLNAEDAQHDLPAFGNQMAEAQTVGRIDATGNAVIPATTPTRMASGGMRPNSSRAALGDRPSTPPVSSATSLALTPFTQSLNRAEAAPAPGTQTPPVSRAALSPAAPSTVAPSTVAPSTAAASPAVPTPAVPTPAVPSTAARQTTLTLTAAAFPRPTLTQASAQRPPAAALSSDLFVRPSETAPASTLSASAAAPRVTPSPRPTSSGTASSGAARPASSVSSGLSAGGRPTAPQATAATAPTQATAGRSPAHFTAPIEIPVTPPRMTAAAPVSTPPSSQAGFRQASYSAQPAFEQPIEIPVTPPPTASRAVSLPLLPPRTAQTQVAARPASEPVNLLRSVRPRPTTAPVRNANVLPVPNGNIPQGYVGSLPRVTVYSDPLRRNAGSGPAVNRAVPQGLRYRVLVDASNPPSQNLVRSLAPGAFPTSFNGRSVMQAGAFSSLENANAAAQMLSGRGLRVAVQRIQ